MFWNAPYAVGSSSFATINRKHEMFWNIALLVAGFNIG